MREDKDTRLCADLADHRGMRTRNIFERLPREGRIHICTGIVTGTGAFKRLTKANMTQTLENIQKTLKKPGILLIEEHIPTALQLVDTLTQKGCNVKVTTDERGATQLSQEANSTCRRPVSRRFRVFDGFPRLRSPNHIL